MEVWLVSTFWFFLALLADFLSIRLKIAIAITEILVGVFTAYLISLWVPQYATFGSNLPWIQFLAQAGAVTLIFLAGTELDSESMKGKIVTSIIIGLASLLIPFLGCTAVAYYLLKWNLMASWLTGIALATSSVSVVYAIMLELGTTKTHFGKVILASCFVTDLSTVLALSFIFSPFTWKSVIFILTSAITFIILPKITKTTFKRWGHRSTQQEIKYLFFFLFGLGFLAFWSGSEPILPSYIMGVVVARVLKKEDFLVQKLRGIIFGVLTPFYFIRAGAYVSIPVVIASPMIFLVLFAAKIAGKAIGVYPSARLYKYDDKQAIYMTLLMSTGLAFGTIASLYALSHRIIDDQQYSLIVAAVVTSAVIPTMIANTFFLPKRL